MVYRPSEDVEWMHEMPHLGSELQEIDSHFGMVYGTDRNDYTQGVMRLPVIVTSVLSFVLVCAAIWFILSLNYSAWGWTTFPMTPSVYRNSRAFGSISVGTKENTGHGQWSWYRQGFAAAIHSHPSIARLVLIGTGLLALLVGLTLFYGNNRASNGLVDALDASERARNTFEKISSRAAAALAKSKQVSLELRRAVASASCQSANPLRTLVDMLEDSTDALHDSTESVTGALDEYDEALTYYGSDVKDATAFALFTAVLITLGGLYIAYFRLKNRRAMSTATLVSFMSSGGFIASACYFFMGSVILSDFCMDPAKYAVQMSPKTSAQNIFGYYVKCQGQNVLSDQRYTAYNLSAAVNVSVSLFMRDDRGCPGDVHLTEMKEYALGICSDLDSMRSYMECGPLQHDILDSLEHGVCPDMAEGAISLWASQLATAVALLLLGLVMGLAVHSMPLLVPKKHIPAEEPLVVITDSRDYGKDDVLTSILGNHDDHDHRNHDGNIGDVALVGLGLASEGNSDMDIGRGMGSSDEEDDYSGSFGDLDSHVRNLLR